ncbi:cysteine desulfurase [Candidatus Woesearchaeota archaeon]|nr:cysteine desulfurase [Candidatus Woesearchaeota archaeon]
MKSYYFDYAAATPICKEALEEYNYISEKFFANPSSSHYLGNLAKQKLEEYRMRAAKILHCLPEEIIFTSGGTESNFIAISGVINNNYDNQSEIITSHLEHPSIIEVCKQKTKQVKYATVDKTGIVSCIDLKKKITRKTKLITIHYANNELGCIQPLSNIKKISNNIIFHSDACQGALLELNVKKLGVDLLTLNSAKCYGPRGVGLLYKKESISLSPVIVGGGQEFGLRSGTHNLAGIGSFVVALEVVQKQRKKILEKLTLLRNYFIIKIKQSIANLLINQTKQSKNQLPSIINIGFKSIVAEELINYLSSQGIAISKGSACSAGIITLSHVLQAINANPDYGYIRISFGKDTTQQEVDYLIKSLIFIVNSLRNC